MAPLTRSARDGIDRHPERRAPSLARIAPARIDLSAVIVTFNSAPEIAACLSSLQSATLELDLGGEVIIVDNASQDGTAELALKLMPQARVNGRHRPSTGQQPLIPRQQRDAPGENHIRDSREPYQEECDEQRLLSRDSARTRRQPAPEKVRVSPQ